MTLDHSAQEKVIELEDPAVLIKRNEAMRRAIPVTRLVDYGVPIGDALAIHARTDGELPGEWHLICQELALVHVRAGREAFAQSATHTCAEESRHAASLYQAAQLAFNRDTVEKLRLYGHARQAFHAFSMLAEPTREARVQELRLTSTEGELFGWQVSPLAAPAKAAVILVGGLSGWGAVYFAMARSLARRGLMCVLAEGPGQGSTRLVSGMHMSASTFPIFSRFVDHAQSSGARRIGVWGNSFGGLFAARLAALDARVDAVCINGAPMVPTVPAFRTAREQLCALFGLSSEDELQHSLAALRLDAGRHRIEAAMLVVEGGQDPLVPLGAQHEFLALAPGRGSVMSWADGEHTIYNHWEQRNARVSDWFCATLAASAADDSLAQKTGDTGWTSRTQATTSSSSDTAPPG